MNSMNISGRLGSPAEVRSTQAGKKVTSFEIAVDLGFGDKKKTTWVKCAWWGDRGEKVAQYLTKGTEVSVLARLADLEAFTKRDGSAGAAIKVDVIELKLHGGGKKDDTGQDAGGGTGKGWDAPPDLDDEIPF